MNTWTFIRFLHIVGILVFVGGQLTLALVVTPAAHKAGANDELMRSVGKRFGLVSGVALIVAIASGIAMASHFDLWKDSLLQVKLMLLIFVGVLVFLHIMSPKSRSLSWLSIGTSLLIVWLGVKLTYG